MPRWRLVDDEAHLEIWLHEERRQILCGLRLSDRTMRHRSYKRTNIAASLRPVLAHAMVRLVLQLAFILIAARIGGVG